MTAPTPAKAQALTGPEAEFLQCWRAIKGREPVPQLKFHPTRKWRLDFAFPTARVAVEIHGGTWKKGRHTSGVGFRGDRLKMNAATLMGWRVYELTPDMIQPLYLEEIRDAMQLG